MFERQKKKNGRPKIPPANLRNITIGVRVNALELDTVKNKAKAMNISPAQWLRVAALKRQLPSQPVPQVNLSAYAKLTRLATNLNQLTKAAHEGKAIISRLLLLELKEEVKNLQYLLLGSTSHDCQVN